MMQEACLLSDSITLTRGRLDPSLSTRVFQEEQEEQLEAGVEALSQRQVLVANLVKLQGILA